LAAGLRLSALPRGYFVVVRHEGVSPSAADEVKRAENQSTFRKANERIREVIDRSDVVLPVAPFVCECGDPGCRRLIDVPLAVYADVRTSPRRFLHALEHVDDGTSGKVVGTFDGYAIVEKSGISAQVAEREEAGGS
jgi:hypothetical protein